MSVKSEIVVDDWEGIDDTELDSKLDELKKNVTNSKPVASPIDNGQTFNVMLLNDDECMRTQYVPPEPTVKILKRPSNDKSKEQLAAEARPKAPIKTLQQREQEYAEARLKIFGSAKSAEDEEEESAIFVNKNGSGMNDTNASVSDSFTSRPLLGRNSAATAAASTTTPTASVNSTRLYGRNYSSSQNQPMPQNPIELRRIEDNVIRLPLGPDGSAGFLLKR